jgi:AmiR/NasT family two-component response regulator
MPDARVMIVEDEVIIAKDLEDNLADLGYEVVGVFISGDEAIKQFHKVKPDVVLMDILLKGTVDGFEAAEQIMEEYNTPIIFITGNSDEDTIEKMRQFENCEYLLKPIEKNELFSLINKVLQ